VRSRLGRGTILQTVTITAHPTSAILEFKGTGTAYFSQGTAKSAFTGTGTLQPNGRFTLVGRGDYTGGTLYRHVRRKYSFTETAPPPPQPPLPTQPPPPPACAVPAGWQVVASDAQVVVIEDQPSYPIQTYRYCNYAKSALGFQLLVSNDDSHFLGGEATYSTIDGVALAFILYHSTTEVDSPGCNGVGSGDSTVYGFDTTSGNTMSLSQGPGDITAAGVSPPGVGAWILTYDQCALAGLGNTRAETLQSVSFSTGAVTTLDAGDPGETTSSPPSLGSLELYQWAAGSPAAPVVIAWTHDGTWRYEQVG
jgi:hypothetical protein